MGALLGILYTAFGGFASGSFYIPFSKVKNWAWEVYWLAGGLFSWIIVPIFIAFLTIPEMGAMIDAIFNNPAISNNVMWAYIFGVLWGVGGLTFGLSMRYLGMSLGMALALGLTAAFGTLIPPIFDGIFVDMLYQNSGIFTLLGVLVGLIGIGIVGRAGMLKDKNLPEEEKKKTIKEFDFKKGVLVAVFSGFMSACFAFGLHAGKPLQDIAIDMGTPPLFQISIVLVIVLLGGFTTNLLWCLFLMFKNKTYKDLGRPDAPFLKNLIFSGIAGTVWYLQFLFLGMGESELGREYAFAAWSILMTFVIVFSNMWGLILKEWHGSGRKTIIVLLVGLLVLVSSTAIIGYGNYEAGKYNEKMVEITKQYIGENAELQTFYTAKNKEDKEDPPVSDFRLELAPGNYRFTTINDQIDTTIYKGAPVLSLYQKDGTLIKQKEAELNEAISLDYKTSDSVVVRLKVHFKGGVKGRAAILQSQIK